MTPEQLKTAVAGLTKRRDQLDAQYKRLKSTRRDAESKRDALLKNTPDKEKRDAIKAEDAKAFAVWNREFEAAFRDWKQTVNSLAKLQNVHPQEVAGPEGRTTGPFLTSRR